MKTQLIEISAKALQFKITTNNLQSHLNSYLINKAIITAINHCQMNKHMLLTEKMKNSLLEIISKSQKSSSNELRSEIQLRVNNFWRNKVIIMQIWHLVVEED